jgi:hypothetical protein
MVPTLFILERPCPLKNNKPGKTHPLEECYPSQDESDETSDRKLNKSSSIEDLLNDSERTSYNLQ